MTDNFNRKGVDEMEDGVDKVDEVGVELHPPNDDRQSFGRKKVRKRELGFIPIPKSKRLDPNLKVQEQFVFTWKINLILAGAAVSFARRVMLMGRLCLCPISITLRYVHGLHDRTMRLADQEPMLVAYVSFLRYVTELTKQDSK